LTKLKLPFRPSDEYSADECSEERSDECSDERRAMERSGEYNKQRVVRIAVSSSEEYRGHSVSTVMNKQRVDDCIASLCSSIYVLDAGLHILLAGVVRRCRCYHQEHDPFSDG
jgi:hypothetical protein